MLRTCLIQLGLASLGCCCPSAGWAQEGATDSLAKALIFHAPFDATCDASVSAGDGTIYTAASTARKMIRTGNHCKVAAIAKGQGRFGDALRFKDKSGDVLFYQAAANSGWRDRNWSGTISFWLKLDPNKDLKPGFCDPIQLTERAWNDGAMFIDFDKELPRDLRLGVFPDLATWNPDKTPFEKIPIEKRPMVVVRKLPFSRDTWTHIAFTWDALNAETGKPAVSTLYLNGTLRGVVRRPSPFNWDPAKAAIMIGINYIGDFDDLAIFNRALTTGEVRTLHGLVQGVGDLRVRQLEPSLLNSDRK